MKLTKYLMSGIVAGGMLVPFGAAFAAPAPTPPPAYGAFQPGWDTPPGEYNEFRRKGFLDGIEGARRDAENHRPFTPENRDEYRHPSVPANVYRDYRVAFREGYHRAVRNMTGR